MGGFIWLGKHYLVNWQRPRSPQYSRTKPQRHLQPLHCTPQPICKPHSCGWSGLMKKTIQKSWSPNRTESPVRPCDSRSEEHTSELQSLMRTSYAVFCLKKKNSTIQTSNE